MLYSITFMGKIGYRLYLFWQENLKIPKKILKNCKTTNMLSGCYKYKLIIMCIKLNIITYKLNVRKRIFIF